MGPPPQLPVGAPIPPPPQHPHAMYHPQHRNQQQQQQHPNGYPQGYPPQSQATGMNRYGPPPMHTMVQQQQHSLVHHHQNHSVAPVGYRHPAVQQGGRHPIGGNPGHHHYLPMVPGAAHSMGPMQSQHHHRHQYPPRPFHVHSHQATLQQQQLHAPYPSMATNLPVPTVPHSGTAALNPKSNESAILSGHETSNVMTSESSEQDTDAASLLKDTDYSGKVVASIHNKPSVQVGENCDGAMHSYSPTPTAVSFRDCIDQTSNKASASSILGESKTTTMESRNAMTVMSPITMCFERMLGAAEAIKTPGSASLSSSSKKRGPLSKKILPLNTNHNIIRNKRKSIDGELNPFDEIQEDPDLERLVILQMAMQRNQHFQSMTDGPKCDSLPPLPPAPKREVCRIIKEGFFWREYPACEQILYNHMHKYYEISAIQKNYKVQQYFNNVLVEEVRKAAKDSGFTVDPEFCDKMLRDRIRCFYKTHLQNAKKRLATLMKHAESYENQCLVAVFIRCVRNPDLSFEDSLAMANTVTQVDQENMASGANTNSMITVTKKRKTDSIEEKLNAIITGSIFPDTSISGVSKALSTTTNHAVGPM